MLATLRTAALKLLYLAGFNSIRDGLHAVMHDIKDLGHPQQPGFVARDGAFCQTPCKTLNELLGTHIANPPSDSTFRWRLSQLDVEAFESLSQQWITAQSCVPEEVDTSVCDGKLVSLTP